MRIADRLGNFGIFGVALFLCKAAETTGANGKRRLFMHFPQRDGFVAGNWQKSVNVRNFIQTNYTPYTGDDSFLCGATARTDALMEKLQALFKEEKDKGGVLDVDTHTVSSPCAYAPGYLDKEQELIVGLQTDAPLKRGVFPFGGIRMARESCKAYGYTLSEEIEQAIFDNYKSIPLSLDSSKESVVSFEKDGNLIKLSRLELKLDETDTNHLVHDLVLIEADGNRIDIIKNDNIIPVDDQWAGYSQRINEDGTRELYYTLGKIIDPKTVQIELNGEVIN